MPFRRKNFIIVGVLILFGLLHIASANHLWERRPTPTSTSTTATGTASASTASASATPTGTASTNTTSTTTPTVQPSNIPVAIPDVTLSPMPTGASTILYKIGNNITFTWNCSSTYTTNISIKATAQINDDTSQKIDYIIGTNITLTDYRYEWVTANNINPSLVSGTYRLYIWDSDRGENAIPQAGYLLEYANTVFKMYAPQKDYQCGSCFPNEATSRSIRSSLITSFFAFLIVIWLTL